MKYISTKEKMPTQPHWAIIEFDFIWIPADERSRTNPGHGYPERSESVVKYIAFTDEAEWKGEIQKRMTSPHGRKDNFIAVKVSPASIQTQINVSVS